MKEVGKYGEFSKTSIPKEIEYRAVGYMKENTSEFRGLTFFSIIYRRTSIPFVRPLLVGVFFL